MLPLGFKSGFVFSKHKNLRELCGNVRKKLKTQQFSCTCKHVQGVFKKEGVPMPPKCPEGHFFFANSDLGHDFGGMSKEATFVPTPTVENCEEDLVNAFRSLNSKLRVVSRKKVIFGEQLDKRARLCTRGLESPSRPHQPRSGEVCMSLSKKIDTHMVCTEVDKNKGGLIWSCPELYKKHYDKCFDIEAQSHYEKVHIKKFNRADVTRHFENLAAFRSKCKVLTTGNMPAEVFEHPMLTSHELIYSDDPKNKGGESDLRQWFKWIGKAMGWEASQFDPKGGVGRLVAFHKFKNIKPRKWEKIGMGKMRPIHPYTKHHWRKRLSRMGRAWATLAAALPQPHMVLNSSLNFPDKLAGDIAELRNKIGPNMRVWNKVTDISQMYTELDKSEIMHNMWRLLQCHRGERHGRSNTVSVPRRGKGQPTLRASTNTSDYLNFSYMDMLEGVMFSLSHAVSLKDGDFVRQKNGIPMGDWFSPGLAIGTTAMNEKDFMLQHDGVDGIFHKGQRYIDDLHHVMAYDCTVVGHAKVAERAALFEKKCYPPCLILEEESSGAFLENIVCNVGTDVTCKYWVKNWESIVTKGVLHCETTQHHGSFNSKAQKKSQIVAALSRARKLSSPLGLVEGVVKKLLEFKMIGYPLKMIDIGVQHMISKECDMEFMSKWCEIVTLTKTLWG